MSTLEISYQIFITLVTSFILLIGIVITGFAFYINKQQEKIPNMTFEECLHYTLNDSNEGVITVGIIKDGKTSYKVYGKDGNELNNDLYNYEIGSLTKTFTAALIQKAIDDNKINLNEKINKYLELPENNNYPTISRLLTHTSGYKGYYLELPMIKSYFTSRNEFYGIKNEMILTKLSSLTVKDKDYKFLYSNFGYAVLGCILESVYNKEYTILLNDFIQELNLTSTYISSTSLKPTNGWDWDTNDAYLPAGAIIANITDILKYAQYQLDNNSLFNQCHRVIKEIDASSKNNKMMNINMDAIGMAWIIDKKNDIIWHNGGTTSYNSYLGFCPESGVAVVILSNLSPSYRIPATVMGTKLLLENK